jgi:hypothetical protein
VTPRIAIPVGTPAEVTVCDWREMNLVNFGSMFEIRSAAAQADRFPGSREFTGAGGLIVNKLAKNGRNLPVTGNQTATANASPHV